MESKDMSRMEKAYLNRVYGKMVSSSDSTLKKKINQETFTIKLLPIDRSIREDKQLIFDDVKGVMMGDYPRIEIQKASEPIKVTMIVPEGYYLIEDHTKTSSEKGE